MVDSLLAAGYHGFREGNFLPLAHRLTTTIERHFASFDIGTPKVMIGCIDQAMIERKINQLFRSIVNGLNQQGPWFDKSGGPEMIRFLPTIRALWPDAAVIFMKRRAIENIASRTKKFPETSFEKHCLDWATTMAAWRDVRAMLGDANYIEVDQRDMIREPSEVASKLTDFLSPSSDRERPLREMLALTRPQEGEPGNAGRSLTLDTVAWSAAQKEIFLTHCSSEMAAFGYTLNDDYRIKPIGYSPDAVGAGQKAIARSCPRPGPGPAEAA